MDMGVKTKNIYTATLRRACEACKAAGRPHACEHKTVVWADKFQNAVVTEGLNLLLNNSFDTVASGVTWYVGLKNAGSVVGADTLATHSGWTEFTDYTGNRQAWTKNAAASAGAMSNSSSKASFAITNTGTIAGAFMASVASGTSGQLYGAGDFAASRGVLNGDTLDVQVDLSVS